MSNSRIAAAGILSAMLVLGGMMPSVASAGDFCSSSKGYCAPPIRLGVVGAFTYHGLSVQSVKCGSLAERLGVREGDVIVKLNGRRLDCRATLVAALNAVKYDPNGHIELVVIRISYNYGHPVQKRIVLHADFGGHRTPVALAEAL